MLVTCFEDPATQCNVFLDQVQNLDAYYKDSCDVADILDSEMTWPALSVRSCALSCSHTFSSVAIITHFISNQMRCPLCRAGYDNKLDVNCFYGKRRKELIGNARGIESRSLEGDMSVITFDMTQVERDFLLVAEIISRGAVVVLSSRLDHCSHTEDTWHEYTIQRNFFRNLKIQLHRALLNNEESACQVKFSITHPCLLQNPASGFMSALWLSQLCNSTDVSMTVDVPLALQDCTCGMLKFSRPCEHNVQVNLRLMLRREILLQHALINISNNVFSALQLATPEEML